MSLQSSNLSNSTLETNASSDWSDPRRDSLYIVIPVTLIYLVIFLTGLVGNVITCIVISRNRHMHTATNYYLFSLACSDLLLLVSGLPQEMYVIWSRYPYIFGEVFCIVQGFAAETSANATVLTITAFTVERYVAICHPFLSHMLSTLSRAVRLIICIWLLALALAVPQAIQFGIIYTNQSAETAQCTVKWVLIHHAFEISTVVFFLLPMTLISVLYVLIGLKLRRSRLLTAAKRASVTGHHVESTQNYVINMLVAVVVGFFICWAPFHAQRLLATYGNQENHFTIAVYSALTYVSGVLYYLSTTINPLLYHIMSHKFRAAFKATLTQALGRKRKHNACHLQTYSMLYRSQPNNTAQRCQPDHSIFQRQRQLSVTELANLRRLQHRNNSVPPMHGSKQGRPSLDGRKRGGSASSQATITTSIGKLSLERCKSATPVKNADSGSISNSSLQDIGSQELCSTELAQYMGQLNRR